MRRLERYCALGGVAGVEGLALERVPGIHVGDRPRIPDQWHPARVAEAVRARLMAAWGGLHGRRLRLWRLMLDARRGLRRRWRWCNGGRRRLIIDTN
jgi:hypothetical protein